MAPVDSPPDRAVLVFFLMKLKFMISEIFSSLLKLKPWSGVPPSPAAGTTDGGDGGTPEDVPGQDRMWSLQPLSITKSGGRGSTSSKTGTTLPTLDRGLMSTSSFLCFKCAPTRPNFVSTSSGAHFHYDYPVRDAVLLVVERVEDSESGPAAAAAARPPLSLGSRLFAKRLDCLLRYDRSSSTKSAGSLPPTGSREYAQWGSSCGVPSLSEDDSQELRGSDSSGDKHDDSLLRVEWVVHETFAAVRRARNVADVVDVSADLEDTNDGAVAANEKKLQHLMGLAPFFWPIKDDDQDQQRDEKTKETLTALSTLPGPDAITGASEMRFADAFGFLLLQADAEASLQVASLAPKEVAGGMELEQLNRMPAEDLQRWGAENEEAERRLAKHVVLVRLSVVCGLLDTFPWKGGITTLEGGQTCADLKKGGKNISTKVEVGRDTNC